MIPVTVHGDPLSASQDIDAGATRWAVPEEVPIAFVYNRRNYAVMMGTPEDLVDFATGFSLTERVVRDLAEIRALDIHLSERGADMRFKISQEALERLDITQRRRNMVGSASCGLCGLENADVLFEALPRVADTPITLEDQAIRKALKALRAHQPLNAQTRSVHGAAWVNYSGDIQMAREDVGRHNALDKLLGAMAQQDIDPATGFVLISSRCSYEMVEKAARRGVQAILSVSAPTHFALRKAKTAHMAIYARHTDISGREGAVRLL